MQQIRVVFAERLKQLMNESSMTQTDLANKIGISRQSVSLYLNAERTPDIDVLNAVSEVFCVSADWLLGLSNFQTSDGDMIEFCRRSGLSETAALILTANSHTEEFEKLFNSIMFESLLAVLEDIEAESKQWLEFAEKNDFISDSDIDYVDMYRYRAHKIFDIVLDDFDARTYNAELNEKIKDKTQKLQRQKQKTIDLLKHQAFEAKTDSEKEKLIKQFIDKENEPLSEYNKKDPAQKAPGENK